MSELPEIKPCPFCGSEDLNISASRESQWDDYSVYCESCFAAGPILGPACGSHKERASEAIKQWNAAHA